MMHRKTVILEYRIQRCCVIYNQLSSATLHTLKYIVLYVGYMLFPACLVIARLMPFSLTLMTFANKVKLLSFSCYFRVLKSFSSPQNIPRKPRGEGDYSSTLSLTSKVDGVGGQRHDLATVTPGETHCVGGWVGPRSDLDWCGKSLPHRKSIPGQPSPQRVALLTELSGPTLPRSQVQTIGNRRLCREFN